MNYGTSTSSWKPWSWVRLDWILIMRDIYINSNLSSLKKLTSSNRSIELKGCVHYIFASLCFKFKLQKIFFIPLKKLFLFFRISNFRILHFQISWRRQMHKHETRNTFYWITYEANTFFLWNLASLCHIKKEKNSSKTLQKLQPEN